MPKIQFNLPEDVDKKLRLYVVEHNLKTKAEAIILLLREKDN